MRFLRSRVVRVGSLVLASVAVLVAGVYAALIFAVGFCGGDGGVPNVEPGSASDAFCDGSGLWVAFLGPPLVLAAGLGIAAERGRYGWAWVAVGAAAATMFVPMIVLGILPG